MEDLSKPSGSPPLFESRYVIKIHAGDRTFLIAGIPISSVRDIHHVGLGVLRITFGFPVDNIGIATVSVPVNLPLFETWLSAHPTFQDLACNVQQMFLRDPLRQLVTDDIFVHFHNPLGLPDPQFNFPSPTTKGMWREIA